MDFSEADALNRAIRLVAIRHRARAAAILSGLGLHPGQEVLLLELDARGPQAQVQLAAALGCEPPSVSLMARKLEAAGLITRMRSQRDSRRVVVELTAHGASTVALLKEQWRQLAEATIAGLETTSVIRLQEALDDLVRSLYADRRRTLERSHIISA